MERIAAVSAPFLVGLLVVTAAGQPPAGADKKAEKKAAVPSVDQLVAAALAHDPDVRMALAKVQLAEAEAAKARQAVTLRVMSLRGTIDEQKAAVEAARAMYAVIHKQFEAKIVSQSEVLVIRTKLEASQAALARAETELKLITGGSSVAAPCGPALRAGNMVCTTCHVNPFPPAAAAADPSVARGLAFLAAQQWATNPQNAGRPAAADDATRHFLEAIRAAEGKAVQGPMPDRIRAALDKKVTLAPKGEKVSFEKALAAFKKDAGLDVPVRVLVRVPEVTSEGEEMTVGAWFQLFQDFSPGTLYVREYGLLFTARDERPADAQTVSQFWQTRPAAAPARPLPEAAAEGRYKGKPLTVAADALEDLTLAVYRLHRGLPTTNDPPVVLDKDWTAALAGDHLRVVVPNPSRYGGSRTGGGAAEYVIDLSKSPSEYPVVLGRRAGGGPKFKHDNPGTAQVKAFAEALQKAGIGK